MIVQHHGERVGRHWKWRWAKESCTFSKEEKESRYKRQKSQAGKKLVAETASTSLFLSSQETSVPASNPRMSNANFRGIRVFLLNRWSQFLFLSFFFFFAGRWSQFLNAAIKSLVKQGQRARFPWHLAPKRGVINYIHQHANQCYDRNLKRGRRKKKGKRR